MESALVIEDAPLLAKAICRDLRLLNAFGTMRIADCVAGAVEAVREMPSLRLVTVDLKLQEDEQAGFRILESLRRERPEPLAAIVTGFADQLVRKRARRLGIPVLTKPYPANAMRRLVDRALAWPIPWETTAHLVTERARQWRLTRAEHRVLCWKVAGRDADAYRVETGLAASTFAFYLKEIARKARWQGGWTDLERALLRESLTAANG